MKCHQPMPGSLLAQGIVGGALGGFAYVFFITLGEGNDNFKALLASTLASMLLGSLIGAIEATSFGGLYWLTGTRMGLATRASIATVVVTLIVLFAGIQLGGDESKLTRLLITTMSFVIPPLLFIDSNFRASQLFTFGSMAVRGVGFNVIFESRSVGAIVGTLPLRFLSLGMAGVWLLSIAAHAPKGDGPYVWKIIVAGTPLLYLAISAFLTFKSPAKLILLFLGIGGNIPVFLGGWLAFSVYSAFSHAEDLLITGIICCAFLITWAIFLFARLTVDTDELIPLSIFPSILPARSEDHENCDYGSSGFYRHTPDTSSRV
ncbi:MAG TPA: hypothetical protein VFT48_16060 [Pyrinomonadaceae bacterium]|nr:hypothetical protein [Pyrinomonadaceae bacterium]